MALASALAAYDIAIVNPYVLSFLESLYAAEWTISDILVVGSHIGAFGYSVKGIADYNKEKNKMNYGYNKRKDDFQPGGNRKRFYGPDTGARTPLPSVTWSEFPYEMDVDSGKNLRLL